MKTCTRCRTLKPEEAFYRQKRRNGTFGLMGRCRECIAETNRLRRAEMTDTDRAVAAAKKREWVSRNESRVRHWKRMTRIGASLSEDDVEAMLKAQDYACAICGADEDSARRRFHLDHDHSTGAVRAFLCARCNPGLGAFRDSPALLRAAADYLERHRV